MSDNVDSFRPDGGLVGFFGKVPSHGDFVSAGIQQAIQQTFDRWLQQGIRTSQKQLEADWLPAYRQAPIWRFAIARDICGPTLIAGVMMPSVDKVGRYFPVIIMAQLMNADAMPCALATDEAWFSMAEALITTTLYADFSLSDFASRVAELRLPALTQEMVNVNISQPSVQAASWWWTGTSQDSPQRNFVSEGFPPPEDFMYFLLPVKPASGAAPENSESKLPQSFTRLRKKICLRSAFSSHAGTRAVFNSDSVFVSQNPYIYSIADGMGEGSDGNIAARLASQALAKVPDHYLLEDLYLDTKGKLGLAHGVLRSASEHTGQPSLGASIVTLVYADGQCAIMSAGDARCYMMRDGLLRLLTRDHIEVGIKNRLTNGIGGTVNFVPDITIKTLIDGDRLLLCSAALPGVLSEAAIAELLLSEESIDSIVTALVQDCLIMNVRDNVSAIVLEAVAT